MLNPIKWLSKNVIEWLMFEEKPTGTPPCDFERLCFEIRPCDVILVEGRSRVSNVIKSITNSPWTHSALYIGRLVDIEDPQLREHISWLYDGDPADHLIVEPLLGEGTIISPLRKYAKDHLRICRPQGLSPRDVQRVIAHCAKHLGLDYDVRHILDLFRFLFPYGLIPRHWRSSLFHHNAGESTKTVCSTMIAESFASVQYPILPVIKKDESGYRMFRRNVMLTTPRDFDFSPYFEIIKYPILGINDLAVYRKLPWDQNGIICNDESQCFIPDTENTNISFLEPDELINKSTQAADEDADSKYNPPHLGRES